jgi:hypothetical protein
VVWLDVYDPAEDDDTVDGSRCRCRPGHPRPVIKIADLLDAVAAGQDTIIVR